MVKTRKKQITNEYLKEKYPLPGRLQVEYENALELLDQYDLEEARRKFILEEMPDHPAVLNSLGALFTYKQKFEEAETIFEKVIEIAPDFSKAYANLCLIYAHNNRLEEANKLADEVIMMQPTDAPTWGLLGLFYGQKDDYETALEYHLAAYALDNEYLDGAYNAACAYVILENFDKALEYLRKTLNDSFIYETALQDKELDPLRELPEFKEMMAEFAKMYEIKD